jgi:hypothetical protein
MLPMEKSVTFTSALIMIIISFPLKLGHIVFGSLFHNFLPEYFNDFLNNSAFGFG